MNKRVIAGLAIVCFAGVQAETVTNLTVMDGRFFGDGVGLTNIPVTALVNTNNTVSSGVDATALGGVENTATGYGATVPGGIGNEASGDYSFAAGFCAVATNNGAFVWADASLTNDFVSVTNDEFAVRAAGGLRLVSGRFIGDGSGLTNLPVQAQLEQVLAGISNSPAAGITTNRIATWDAGAALSEHIQGSAETVTITTNLTVQGVITGDGSGLTKVAAGGSDGQVQYNNNGTLAGYTNLFVHPNDGGLAVRERNGNFFRMYNGETLIETNLIVSLRNESGTSVLRLRKDNQDSIRLSGDGTAYIKGNLQLDGQLIADGSGLTNLPVQAQVNALMAGISNSPAATITTNQIASWNSGGELAGSVQLSTGNVSITTNLAVQGTISGDGSGLTKVAAGGSDGQVQYNSGGTLAGYTNLFVHPNDGGLAVRERNGNFFRMYNGETLIETNLIVSLRNESGTSFFRLRQNNQDNIVLKGDGSASVKSLTLGGVTHTEWPVVASGNFVDKDAATNVLTGKMTVQGEFIALYIPPQGDIRMGSYTNGLPQ